MRLLFLAAVLAAAALHADDDPILSLHPLGPAGQSLSYAPIEGLWTSRDGLFNFTFRVETDGAGGYTASLDRDPPFRFRLFKVGGEMVADLTRNRADCEGLALLHSFARIHVEGELLQVEWIGKKPLEKELSSRTHPALEQLEDGSLILTAPTATVRRLVQAYLNRTRSPDETYIFYRAKPEEIASDLNERSWQVVIARTDAAACTAALAEARKAVALVPDNPDYWGTLGAARYRTGAWKEGLAAMERAKELRAAGAAADPGDLAFEAMLRHRLGRLEEAKTALAELRRLLATRRYRTSSDLQRLLNEAEDLIEPGMPKETTSLETGPQRREFPLQIAQAVFTHTELQLLLVNLTDRVVEQATVGVLLEDNTSQGAVKLSGKVCAADVPPGGFLLVRTPNTGFGAAVAYFRRRGILEKKVSVGVTQVRYADGTEWTMPIDAAGRFEGESDKDVGQRIEALKQAAFGRSDASMFSVLFDRSQQRKVSTCRK